MPNKEPSNIIKELIEDLSFIQWVRGENSPKSQEWEYRYQNYPEDREVMDHARLVVEGIPFNKRFISDNRVETAWLKMESALDNLPDKQPSSKYYVRIYGRIVASLALILSAGVAIYLIYQNQEVVHSTFYGERMELTLPDGSQVIMNANSSLTYVRKNPRKVSMTGEIYFNIKKKLETGAAFVVATPDLDIQVLGTEFNVNSHKEKTEVLLDEGSIVLNMKEKGRLLMEPGDLVSYTAAGNKILKQHVPIKPEVITSWKEGVLLLDSISLHTTLSLLEDTYNIKTIIENEKLRDKILVGGVPNDDLETCVQALKTIYRLDIQITSDTLIVR